MRFALLVGKTMGREICSAEKIRDWVHNEVQMALATIDDKDKENIRILTPQSNETDSYGCNWDMPRVRNPGVFCNDVYRVIRTAQSRFNLPQ